MLAVIDEHVQVRGLARFGREKSAWAAAKQASLWDNLRPASNRLSLRPVLHVLCDALWLCGQAVSVCIEPMKERMGREKFL